MSSGTISMVAGALSIIFAIVMIIYILTLIANIMLFEKAGKRPWLGVIPFVDSYTMYSTFWDAKLFWVYIVLYAVSLIFVRDSAVLSLIVGIAMLVLNFLLQFKISKAFGKNWGYAIGLCLLYPIVGIVLFNKNSLITKTEKGA